MAGKRDYESAPASETLGIDHVIRGLASDLEALRAGKISTQDAIARSLLAKQIFNGFRIYLQGARLLSDRAVPIAAPTREDQT
jgi:hypothetical protein